MLRGVRAIRVLIADDDSRGRGALRQMLEAASIEVVEASSAKQALAIARAARPDAVVFPWLIPGGGLVLARALVDEFGLADRVVVIADSADLRDQRAARSARVQYLVRPPDPDRLIWTICSRADPPPRGYAACARAGMPRYSPWA